jgi:hypothetical protein
MFVASGLMFGPLLIMPIFMVGAIGGFLAQPSGFHWGIPVAGFVIPFLVVVGLEVIGVVPRTIEFSDGAMILTAPTLGLTWVSAAVIIGLTLGTQLVNVIFISLSRSRAQIDTSNLIHAQRWHLEQLLPHAADGETTGSVPKLEP